MKIIQSVLETSDEGDKILISFPDIYSFYTVSSWLSERFGEIFWVLWTDASVERMNHFAKKYGFPKSGEALLVATEKDCIYLQSIDKLDIGEVKEIKNFIPENRLVISFGVNFLPIYNYDISKVIEALIEIDRGILITAVLGRAPEELLTFHDVFIEIIKSEDSFIAYHNYIAKLTFSMKGGVTVVSDNLER